MINMINSSPLKRNLMQAKTPLHLFLLAFGYLILIIVVNPLGNFPINDDWAYARSVLSLVEDGKFNLLDWGAMTLVSQVVWGAIWVKLFGFSFVVLRLSTIVLGLVALMGSYYFLLGITKEHWIALTGSCVLLVQPLFLVLANSFMTDVPFLALSLWSVFFFFRAIERDSISDALLGLCFAIVALLLRQIALVLPLAFLFGYAARFNFVLSIKRVAVTVVPFALSVLIYIGYIKWLQLSDKLPHALTWSQDRLNTNFLALFDSTYTDLVFTCRNAAGMLLYLGFFSLPLMLPLYLRRGDKNFPGLKMLPFGVITGMLLLMITIILLANDFLMPVHGNLITTYGIGPFTLRDVFALNLPHLDLIPRAIWQLITALSVLGALLLSYGVLLILRGLIQDRVLGIRGVLATHWHEIFLGVLIMAYVAPLLITDYFDRYLLFLLPFIFALAPIRNRNANKAIPSLPSLLSLSLIPISGIFSVTLAHDYMNWNRVRLLATEWVKNEHQLDYSSIDSGFEFNGFYGYDSQYHNNPSMWVRDDKYLITYGNVPGYTLEKRFTIERSLPIGPREIMVLRRTE